MKNKKRIRWLVLIVITSAITLILPNVNTSQQKSILVDNTSSLRYRPIFYTAEEMQKFTAVMKDLRSLTAKSLTVQYELLLLVERFEKLYSEMESRSIPAISQKEAK